MPSPNHLPRFLLVAVVGLLISTTCTRPNIAAPKIKSSENRLLRRRLQQIYLLYVDHKIVEALPLYLNAAERALQLRDYESAAKFLINAGGCQLVIFRYQDALGTMERARQTAERTGDNDVIAISNANIASLYLQMSNYGGAAIAAKRALSALRDDNPQFAQVMIPVAQVLAEQHRLTEAEPLLRQAIDAAYRTGKLDTAAWAWDYLGYRYTLEHRLPEADRALTESLRLRKMFKLADLGSSYYHLAVVRSDQGQPLAAAALLDSAVAEIRKPGNATPAWNIYFARGRLLAKAGHPLEAWNSLGRAVQLAGEWRTEVVANDANRTSAETALSDLYSLYIEVGNSYAASKGISLARQTFEAAEENRAASLRALAERETGWHNKLPARYWEALSSLQDAERAVLREDSLQNRLPVARLRAVLDELEAASGVPRKSSVQSAAAATQKKLDANTVLFSFHLGERYSWLWAVTKEQIAVFPIGPRASLTPHIHEFVECVRRGSPCTEERGASLYRMLFGALPRQFSTPQRWLFSLDQELFALPMAALVTGRENGKPVYLGATRALQAVPGALLYAAAGRHPDFTGPLLGVGDPVYNRADPRWRGNLLNAGFSFSPPRHDEAFTESPLHFARLWGAADEVRAVAQTWGAPDTVVLTGASASRQRLWEEMQRKPAVVHFATHILEAADQLHTGWIALSMAADGRQEFLSPADIAARRFTTSLVVLNGCSSGLGEVRSGSGLMGLTRAWIAAGASDVLATRWPGPDDDGSFFLDFYQNLKAFPENGPAFALLSARRKCVRHGGWRANPQFWASYFLTGID